MKKFLLLLIVATCLTAQNQKPCSAPEASQFNFWIGEWNLAWGDSGKGTNTITKIMGGCVVQEDFNGGASPLRGRSVSVYDQNAGVWKQTWVDNQGGYLDFSGKFEDGKMILQREATRKGKAFLQRMVWYNIEANKLDWNWESSQDGGKTWKLQWRIHYTRK